MGDRAFHAVTMGAQIGKHLSNEKLAIFIETQNGLILRPVFLLQINDAVETVNGHRSM